MFDLITGEVQHAPRLHAAPVVASIVAHAVVVGAIFGATVFLVSDQLPKVRMMMAFVAAPPMPPVPPPAPAPVKAAERRDAPKPTAVATAAAPTAMPVEFAPEPAVLDFEDEGPLVGVEGGLPGGIVGGSAGVIEVEIPPPPPPPPPPALRAPIRVGGEVKEPALLHRVDPVYPAAAVAAGLEGIVILEAVVDRDGSVESLRVLRSQGVFDKPALEAVRQWRYSPVLLNGRPEKFILTVAVTFRLEKR